MSISADAQTAKAGRAIRTQQKLDAFLQNLAATESPPGEILSTTLNWQR